jgi:hypothetical protein
MLAATKIKPLGAKHLKTERNSAALRPAPAL